MGLVSGADSDIIETLIGAGANLAHATKDGWTALHLACSGSEIESVDMLLDIDDVAIDAQSDIGFTALRNPPRHSSSPI